MSLLFIKILINRQTFYELIRFVVVGFVATAIHYGIYWLLVHCMNATIAYSIGYALSFVCNFILTSLFTFRQKASIKKGVWFGVAHGVNYLLHVLFLNFFLWLDIPKSWAPIPVFAIVIPVNFLLVRFVFKRF